VQPDPLLPPTISSTILDSIKSLRSQPYDKITLPQTDTIYQEGLKSFKAMATTVISLNATMTLNATNTLDSMGFKNLRGKSSSTTPVTVPKPVPVSPVKSNSPLKTTPPPSTPSSSKLLPTPDPQPLSTLTQILSSIYKSYTLSETNEAILSSTRQTLFPIEWSLKDEIGMRIKNGTSQVDQVGEGVGEDLEINELIGFQVQSESVPKEVESVPKQVVVAEELAQIGPVTEMVSATI
jgi:hypothetical protein